MVRVLLAILLVAGAAHAQHRGGVFRLGSYQASGTIDPQISYETDVWQILYVTQDQLVAFRKAEGAAGLAVVPDLAEALPEVRDGGRTYVFTLRRGVRFSNGKEVGVADVVASFRRMFRVSGPNVGSWYGIIVGAQACLAAPASCMLEGGVVGDAVTRTVTIHLTRADSEFTQKLALPFAAVLPADTPAHDLGTTPPAATGPYMIKSFDALRGLVLLRNPFFHEWSAEAQPDGYVDRIEMRYGLQAEAEVSAIENGALDWMADPPPLDRLAEIGGAACRAGAYPSDAGLLLSDDEHASAAVRRCPRQAGDGDGDQPAGAGEFVWRTGVGDAFMPPAAGGAGGGPCPIVRSRAGRGQRGARRIWSVRGRSFLEAACALQIFQFAPQPGADDLRQGH